MSWPRFRLRFRTMLILVACCAVGLAAWVAFLSPGHRWLRTIHSDDDSLARWDAASRAIKGQVPGVDRAEAIRALTLALSDPSPRVRETSAYHLGQLKGAEARAVAPHLALALKDANPMVRLRAVEALGVIADLDPATRPVAVPALLGALKDARADVRLDSGYWLVMLGHREPAIPVLEIILRDGQDIYGKAALALGLCGSREPAAIEVLKSTAIGSSSPKLRQDAKDALERLAADPDHSRP